MTTTCYIIIGLVFLVLTNLAVVIAFATPYWIAMERVTRGLWAYCDHVTCTWTFKQLPHYLPGHGEDWFLATQGLMCVGLAVTFLALLIATIALCCECRRCNSNHVVAGFLLMGFLILGVAVVVFGVSANSEQGVNLHSPGQLSWSFWLAAASSALSLISSFVYSCQGKMSY